MFKRSETGRAVTVLEAPGELDARNAQAAKDELKALIASGATRVVVDLRNVEFIDSSGIGVLIAALHAARGQGGDVKLAGITASARPILELTRMNRVFGTFQSVAEAVASFD